MVEQQLVCNRSYGKKKSYVESLTEKCVLSSLIKKINEEKKSSTSDILVQAGPLTMNQNEEECLVGSLQIQLK